jgi:hypothetical protein
MSGPVGFEASQGCENDPVAERDVAEFNGLEQSGGRRGRHAWCAGNIGWVIVIQSSYREQNCLIGTPGSIEPVCVCCDDRSVSIIDYQAGYTQ